MSVLFSMAQKTEARFIRLKWKRNNNEIKERVVVSSQTILVKSVYL